MSSYGSKTYPLFKFDTEYKVNYTDDYGVFFDPQIHIFIQVGPWELDAAIQKPRHRRWKFLRHFIHTPIVMIDWSFDHFPTPNYEGDYTENTDVRRKQYEQ